MADNSTNNVGAEGVPEGSGLPTSDDTTTGDPVGASTGGSNGNGGIFGTLFPGMSTNTANAIGQLVGLGAGVGGTALNAAALTNAINYLKGIGGQAAGQQVPSYGAGWTAYGNNNNNVINPIFNGSNPYMSLLQNGVVGNIGTLNGMLPGLTTGAGNLVYQDPTMNAYLGLSTSPINFLNGQATAAGNIVGAGGATPQNSYIANRGNSLAALNPLLSMGQATSNAVDMAGRNNVNAAQTARAQALNRGGGAGAVAGAGAANGGLADFSDAALQNEAGTVQGAQQGQQGLQLNQVLGGLNAAQGAGALQQSLLGTGFNAGLSNATGASSIASNALNQLLGGRLGASNIGSTLAQLYANQNNQLANASNLGLNATLGAGQLGNQQGNAFLQYASNLLNTQANTGTGIASMLRQSPWAQFLLGGGATGAAGGGLNIGQILGGIGNIAQAGVKAAQGGGNFGINNFDPFSLGLSGASPLPGSTGGIYDPFGGGETGLAGA